MTMNLSDETVDQVRKGLVAIRNRGQVVAGYFPVGTGKWDAAMAIPRRAQLELDRLEVALSPPPSPPVDPAPLGVRVTPDTVTNAIADAKAGDRLILVDGTYRLPTIVGLSGVEFVAEGAGVVCVAGEGGTPLGIRDSTDLLFAGLRIREAVGATSAAVYGMAGSHRITLDSCEVGPTPRQGVFTERGTSGWVFRNQWTHHCYTGNDPNRIHGLYLEGTGHLVDGGVTQDIEAFGLQIYPWARGVTVRSHVVRRCGRSGVLVGGDVADTLIDSCRFEARMEYAVDTYKLTGGNNRVVNSTADFPGAFTPRPGLGYIDNKVVA